MISFLFFSLSFSNKTFIVAARPGRVVGPVLPYENVRQMNNSYDGGVCVQNAVLPPQSNSPHCFFKTNTGKILENCRMEDSQVKQQSVNGSIIEIDYKGQPPQYSQATVNPAERNSNPYCQSQSKAGIVNNSIPIDAKLLQAQSQFVVAGAAVAVAAHRDAGAMQLGLT